MKYTERRQSQKEAKRLLCGLARAENKAKALDFLYNSCGNRF